MTIDRLHVFDNFLTKNECETILNELNPELTFKRSISPVRKRFWSDENVRNNELSEKISEALRNIIEAKGYKIDKFDSFEFLKFIEGDHYQWHNDSDSDKSKLYTIVIQLNEDYEEGFLQLKDNSENIIQLDKKVGTMYLFFSSIQHRIIPIKSGIRYSLINWVKLIPDQHYLKTLI